MDTLPFAKTGHVKLEGAAYSAFIRDIFILDHWTCKACRRVNPGLTVHHLIKRSKQRLDTRENCLSLCVACHERAERKEIDFRWINEQQRIVEVIDMDRSRAGQRIITTRQITGPDGTRIDRGAFGIIQHEIPVGINTKHKLFIQFAGTYSCYCFPEELTPIEE